MSSRLFIIALISSTVLGQSQVEIPSRPQEKVSRGLSYYEDILKDNPELPEAHFGAGHSAYTVDNFERAQKEFEAAAQSEQEKLQAMSHYNLGNTLHRQGQLDQSLMAYRKAIQLDPEDMDAKYNYELTQRMLQQMQSQQSQQQQSDESKDQEGEDQQQPQQQQEQNPPEQQPSPEPQQKEEQQKEQSPPEKPNAEATLDALKADEENLMKRKLGHAKSAKREKDW